MKHHHLKIFKEYAAAKLAGAKPWEWRYNDRDFRVGDRVSYHVNDCPDHPMNGRVFEIVYLVRRGNWCVYTERQIDERPRSSRFLALKNWVLGLWKDEDGKRRFENGR